MSYVTYRKDNIRKVFYKSPSYDLDKVNVSECNYLTAFKVVLESVSVNSIIMLSKRVIQSYNIWPTFYISN